MNEMSGGPETQRRTVSPSSSPLASQCCGSTQSQQPLGSQLHRSWKNHPVAEEDEDEDVDVDVDVDVVDCPVEMKKSENTFVQSYEELFCARQACIPLIGALTISSQQKSDMVKQGYLGKQEQSHRRYFVLREGSHTGPSRLEWYKSQEKFVAVEKSSGKAALCSSKQGVIYLRCCIGVSRLGSSKKSHTVALYAKDETLMLVMGDEQEQDEWYLSIKRVMEEELRDEEHGEGFEEDDDGYCTLPPVAFFKEVWPVTVKSRGLGRSKSLAGEIRLCLTSTSLILVRMSTCIDLPSFTIPLLSVRRFGHLDGSFFLELGRSAPNGPGEIWMEAGDQGNATLAQHIHEVVRETVRAIRALPNFSRSPTSNHNLASKRNRPKYRDKAAHVRPLGCSFVLPPQNPGIQTSPEPCSSDDSQSHPSPRSSGYMQMKREELSVNTGMESGISNGVSDDHHSVPDLSEPGRNEGPGYMMMSPQSSHSSSVLSDYVTMTSPNKHNWPARSSSSSLQTLSSSTSDRYSPVHPSRHQTSQPLVQMLFQSGRSPAQSKSSTSSTGDEDEAFATHRPVYPSPVQASPTSVRGPSSAPGSVSHQSAFRRNWMSSCLPCLQKM